MKLKHFWAEALATATAAFYFLLPSLQAWAATHPGTKIASAIVLLVAMGLKPSPLAKRIS